MLNAIPDPPSPEVLRNAKWECSTGKLLNSSHIQHNGLQKLGSNASSDISDQPPSQPRRHLPSVAW